MKERFTALLAFTAVAAIGAAQLPAPTGTFTLERVLDYPFPDNLIAAPKGATIAWTFNEHGSRTLAAVVPRIVRKRHERAAALTSNDEEETAEAAKIAENVC
jgi:hypothetical protein